MSEPTEFKPEITAVQVQVNRSSAGLTIACRTNPKIEEFFRNTSQGQIEQFDVRVNGRYWTLKDDVPLIDIYALEPTLSGIMPMGGVSKFSSYTINMPGKRILDVDRNSGLNIVNISFIRAVGISDKGIEFNVKGVFSPEQTYLIRDGIVMAVNAFVDAYLRPINLTINLVEG